MNNLKLNLEINSTKPEFLIVGDIHFCNQSPSCRIDNYSETCLNKFEYILNYSIDNEINVIIIEGDVFHKQQIPIHYLTKIISLINEKKTIYYNKYNKELIIASIVGNHDLPFENFKFIERSPICLLFETNCLNHFEHIQIISNKETINIAGFDYSKDIQKSTYENECCVAHCFYDSNLLSNINSYDENNNETLLEKQAIELGYKVYFLGHDHSYYNVLEKNNYYVVRPGSLLRNSSHTHQINRIPCFYHVKKQNNNFYFEKIDVTIALNSKSVFTSESLLKPKTPEIEYNVKTKISDIILSLSEEENDNNSVINILNDIVKSKNINNDIYNLLLRYFSKENVF